LGGEVVHAGFVEGGGAHEGRWHVHFLKHIDHALLGFIFDPFLVSLVFGHARGLAKLAFQFLVGKVVFRHDARNLLKVVKCAEAGVFLEGTGRGNLDRWYVMAKTSVLVKGDAWVCPTTK